MPTSLLEVYERLVKSLGPQHWWPGESRFEVMVGAILVQNTAWRNVEKAIANMREEGLLEPKRLYALPIDELQELIRPAGYFRLKSDRLRNLLQLVVEEYDGVLDDMFAEGLPALREKLLGVRGIGPETADSILLYAAQMPTFVVDTYTHRILARHGWIGYDADYYQIKEHFEQSLPADVPLYNEYHALLVRVGNQFCKRTPKCEECPLCDMLPEGGIVEMEEQ